MTEARSKYRAYSFLSAVQAGTDIPPPPLIPYAFRMLEQGVPFDQMIMLIDSAFSSDQRPAIAPEVTRALTLLDEFEHKVIPQSTWSSWYPSPSVFSVLAKPPFKKVVDAAYKYLPSSKALILHRPRDDVQRGIWEEIWLALYKSSPTRMLLQATMDNLIVFPDQIGLEFARAFQGLYNVGIIDLGSDDPDRSVTAALAPERGSMKVGGVETVYKRKIVQTLETLDLLSRLASYPIAVARVYSKNYHSAFIISRETAENFQAAVAIPENQKLNYNTKLYINQQKFDQVVRELYTNAASYAAEKSFYGVRIIQETQGPGINLNPVKRRDIPLDVSLAVKGITEKTLAGPVPLTYENLFGSHLSSTCPHGCNSVISPTAYYVDLLQFLRYSKTDPTAAIDDKAYSLITHFQARRPDLLDLELSCENALLTIPYIDLVNEVLESWIASRKVPLDADTLAKNNAPSGSPNRRPLTSSSVRIQNNIADLTSDLLAVKPINVDHDVYSDVISHQSYPLSTFPYNFSMDTVRIILKAMSASRHEILEALSLQFAKEETDTSVPPNPEDRPAPVRAMSSFDLFSAGTRKPGGSTLDRLLKFPLSGLVGSGKRAAADADDPDTLADEMTRALVAEKFNLIEGDFIAISGESFSGHPEDAPEGSLKRKNPWEYWGYSNEAEMLDDNTDKSAGLCLIKEQFLRRAEISLPQLVDLMKTRYFRARGGEDPKRMILSVPSDADFRKVKLQFDDGSLLKTSDWDRIQRFIRLWKKIGYDIVQLDAAIHVSPLQAEGVDETSHDIRVDITPDILIQLHLIDGIKGETDLNLTEVIALWDDETLKSLLVGSVVESVIKRIEKAASEVKVDADGNPIPNLVNDSVITFLVATALQMTLEQLRGILKTMRFSTDNESLNVEKKDEVYIIYRYLLASRALKIDPSDLPFLKASGFFNTNGWILHSPAQAFTCLQKWRSIQSCGLSPQELHDIGAVSGGVQGPSKTESENALLLSTQQKTQLTLKGLDTIFTFRSDIQRKYPYIHEASSEDVQRISASLYDKEMIEKIMIFLETVYPSQLNGGAMTEEDSELEKTIKSEQESFYERVLADVLGMGSLARSTLLSATSSLEQKRLAFYEALQQYLIAREDETGLFKMISGQKLGGVTPEMIRVLAQTVRIQRNEESNPLGDTLIQCLSQNSLNELAYNDRSEGKFEGFFRPLMSDGYRFLDSTSQIHLYINDIQHQIDPTTAGKTNTTGIIELKADTWYKLSYKGYIGDLVWRGLRTDNQNFTETAVVINTKLQTFVEHKVLRTLEIAASIVKKLKLSTDEVFTIQTDRMRWSDVDLGKLTDVGLSHLTDYFNLKKALSKAKPKIDLLTMFDKVDKHADAEQSHLLELLSSATGWPTNWISDFVSFYGKQIGVPVLITSVQVLKRMQAIMVILKKLKNWDINIEILQLVSSSKAEDIDRAAIHLEQIYDSQTPDDSWKRFAGPKVYDKLRENRRSVLIRYLLERQEIKSLRLRDANSLFEYFMIDVQMSPDLKTSRIRQAVSTIQLFVQRCLLGLEVGNGVPQDTIDSTRWTWMRRFNLWEANRRIFLYPENWIDPSLRDNKTDLFKALESDFQQKNLGEDEIKAAVTKYLTAAYELRSLSIQAIYKEFTNAPGVSTAEQDLQVLHIFGRTLSAPYTYYYRSWKKEGSIWSPWVKIEVDIVTHEVDPVGDPNGAHLNEPSAFLIPVMWDSRLFLFLPLFRSCIVQLPTYQDATPQTIGDQKVKNRVAAYYEIRMGWTQYRGGKWSPIQYSSTTTVSSWDDNAYVGKQAPSTWPFKLDMESVFKEGLKFDFATEPQLPSLRSYLFNTALVEQPNVPEGPEKYSLALSVCRWRSTSYQTIKTYRMKSGQLVASDNTIDTASMDLPGSQAPFSRLLLDNKETSVLALQGNKHDSSLVKIDDSSNSLHLTAVTARIGKDLRDNLYHELAPHLLQATASNDLGKVFEVYPDRWGYISSEAYGNRKGELTFNEGRTPYAIYNWEVAVHTPMFLMDRLLKSQQYDLALQLAQYVFNPFAPDKGEDLASCWNWPAFATLSANQAMASALGGFDPSQSERSEFIRAVEEWRDKPFQPYLVARGRVIAYMKWIVVKYLEILVAYGDYYFRQASFDTLPSATQLYVQAAHIFGTPEVESTRMASMEIQTYNSLLVEKDGRGGFDSFSDSIVQMEYQWPFQGSIRTLPNIGTQPNVGVETVHSLMSLASTRYFSVPINPKLKEIGNVIKDRLYKIRACLDINGNPLRIPLFDPPIEPGLLVSAVAQSGLGGIDSVLNDLERPMPNYRFLYVCGKAMELCGELKQAAASYLGIKEKRDAEAMTLLRGRQDITLQTFSVGLKEMAVEDAKRTLLLLEDSRKGPTSRMKYYLRLAGEKDDKIPTADRDYDEIPQEIDNPVGELKLNANEILEIASSVVAEGLTTSASVDETFAMVFKLLPEIEANMMPLGGGATAAFDPKLVGGLIEIGASVKKTLGGIANYVSGRHNRFAQFKGQLQERRQMANQAGYELRAIELQIQAQKYKIEMAEKDLEYARTQLDHAREVDEFMKTKYTNEELYSWMDSQFQESFYQIYLMAFDMAKAAEKTFKFEQGNDKISFLKQNYWNSARAGFGSAEDLWHALKRIELAYMEKRAHDYEITKNVSLRQIAPTELIRLRETGQASFEVPEYLFDLDFPGHYARRIKSIAMSMPCLLGPNMNVSCVLRLQEHSYRSDGLVSDSYSRTANGPDPRFRTTQVPIQSIATSNAQADVGAFELNFKDERYIPFEGAGAISKWTAELPDKYRQFNYESISDLVLHIKYTSKDGGEGLKTSAIGSINRLIGEQQKRALHVMIDLSGDFASDWYRLINTPASGDKPRKMILKDLSRWLPYFAISGGASATRMQLHTKAKDLKVHVIEDVEATDISTAKELKEGDGFGESRQYSSDDVALGFTSWALFIDGELTKEDKPMLVIDYCLTVDVGSAEDE